MYPFSLTHSGKPFYKFLLSLFFLIDNIYWVGGCVCGGGGGGGGGIC